MDRTYLNDGAYKVAVELRLIDRQLTEPNRSYAIAYKQYLELNNRKGRAIAKMLLEVRQILLWLKRDAKKVTRKDIESVVLAINNARRRDIYGNEIGIAVMTKRKLKQNLQAFTNGFTILIIIRIL